MKHLAFLFFPLLYHLPLILWRSNFSHYIRENTRRRLERKSPEKVRREAVHHILLIEFATALGSVVCGMLVGIVPQPWWLFLFLFILNMPILLLPKELVILADIRHLKDLIERE